MQAELIDTGSLARSIEAVLFVASEALSIKTLAKLTGAEEADVSLALARIDADYAERGIVLREIAGGYRFASAPAARSVVEAYLMPPKTNLSPAALETLAIVAYLQPVTKGDIEGIRGVSADSVLSTLVDRRFLVEAGRKEVAGRPILYRTTPEFLEAFGLRSLEELPAVDIDAAAPVELALPIPTQAVPAGEEPNTQGYPAPDPAAETEPEPEPAEASAAVDESENVFVP
jgi:segregation and condensation protein B